MTHFRNVIRSPVLCKANFSCYSVLFIVQSIILNEMKEWAGGTCSNHFFAKLQFCPHHFLLIVAKIACGTHLQHRKIYPSLNSLFYAHDSFCGRMVGQFIIRSDDTIQYICCSIPYCLNNYDLSLNVTYHFLSHLASCGHQQNCC